MKILIGLYAWRAAVVVDDDALAVLDIIVIIADVITIEIRNKNVIYKIQPPKQPSSNQRSCGILSR